MHAYITLHHITSHHIALLSITSHHIPLHYITSHHIPLHYITLHSIPFYITLHSIPFHHIPFHSTPLHKYKYNIPEKRGRKPGMSLKRDRIVESMRGIVAEEPAWRGRVGCRVVAVERGKECVGRGRGGWKCGKGRER